MSVCWIAKWSRGLLLLGLLSIGCEQSARNLSLDESAAKQACTTFLETWKAGQSSSDLEPEIIGGDYDWDTGKKLVSFEILPDETNDGTNLHIPVRLVLQGASGGESKVDAMYTVGTSPVVTVVRDQIE